MTGWLDDFAHDIRYGVRLNRKTPVLAAATILTLALGIGLDAGVFTLIDGVLFRARINHDSASFVQVSAEYAGPDASPSGGLPFVTMPDYVAFRSSTRSLRDLAAWSPVRATLTAPSGGAAMTHVALIVSCNFFAAIGPERPLIGRVLQAGDCDAAAEGGVVVIGEDLWRTRYSADPRIVGTSITMNGHAFTVVGVMPSGYPGQLRGPIWIPYSAQPLFFGGRDLIHDTRTPWLVTIGRLGAAYSRADAAAELSVIARQQDRLVPGRKTAIRLGNGSLIDLPEMRAVAFWVVPLIIGALSLVLLLACGNVTLLLLSRAAARRQECAIRLSLGAGRGRLLRMLLAEAFVFAVAALGPALWLALKVPVAVRWLVPTMPYYPFTFDSTSWIYISGVALAAALLAATVPAVESLRRDVAPALRRADTLLTTGRWRAADLLVAAQVAMSLTLMTGAAVFVRAEYRLITSSPGYESDHVLFLAPRIASPPYTSQSAQAFVDQLRAAIRKIPGVDAIASATAPPVASEETPAAGATIRVSGRGKASAVARRNAVSSEYFETMGIRVVRGRTFQSAAAARHARPVIASDSLSRLLWPSGDAIGSAIDFGGGGRGEIVGVVADIHVSAGQSVGDRVVYELQSATTAEAPLLVRFSGDRDRVAAAVRAAIASLNPDAVREPRTLTSIRNEMAARFLRIVRMVLFLGIVAAVLAVIGIYGVVGFAVSRRIGEMGIRAALGATRAQIMRLVIGDSLKPIAAGIAAGMALAVVASLALSRVFASAPIPLEAREPIVYIGVAVLLTIAALSAMVGPARRAAGADPIDALRHD